MGNVGSKKLQTMKSHKIRIRSAQNVGKVLINGTKSSWHYLGPFQTNFSMDQQILKNAYSKGAVQEHIRFDELSQCS